MISQWQIRKKSTLLLDNSVSNAASTFHLLRDMDYFII